MIRRIIIALMTGILSLMLISCTSTITIKDDTLKADIIAYLKDYSDVQEVTGLKVKSQKSVKGEVIAETSFDFSNPDGSFSAEMTLTYDKVNNEWKVVNHEFNWISMNPSSVNTEKVADYIANNPTEYFESQKSLIFLPEYLSLKSTTINSPISTTLTYEYTIQKLNWTFKELYTVEAQYSYPTGWGYTIKDWSYLETSDWAGTWQIKFYNPDGTLAQTINDLVITGIISVTKNKSLNKLDEANTLSATHTYKGQRIYTATNLYNFSTTGLIFTFDNLPTDEAYIRIGMNMIKGSKPSEIVGYEYYATSYLYEKGELTKIK